MESEFRTNLIGRTAHRNWKASLFLFLIILIIHFVAAFLQSVLINIIGMSLYAVFSLVFVKKACWQEIGMQKSTNNRNMLWGVLVGEVLALCYLTIVFITNFNSLNFLVLMGTQQLGYGVITVANAWQFFPIAAIGFCTLSPFTEEIFFRGVVLKSLENKRSRLAANFFQALLFAAVHVAYFWLMSFAFHVADFWPTSFDWLLIIPTFLSITPAGMIYGWVAQKTKSVYSSMLVHAIVNLNLILFVYAFVIPAIG